MNIPMIVWHQQWRKTVWRALIAVICDGKIDKRRVQTSGIIWLALKCPCSMFTSVFLFLIESYMYEMDFTMDPIQNNIIISILPL